jgi:hypothetical protein
LEKAWAKTVGNYEAIEGYYGNRVPDLMDFLTGAPTDTFTTSSFNLNDQWIKIKDALGKLSNYTITATTATTLDPSY